MSIDGIDSLAKREACDDGGYSGVETTDFSQVSGDDGDDAEDDGDDGSSLAKRGVDEGHDLGGGRFPIPPPPPVPGPTPLAVTPRERRGILCLRRCLRLVCPRVRSTRICFIRQVACVRRCQRLFF